MPRLLSVNVGLPRDVTWNGKTVRTSVWKSPVDGRRMVRKLDIDGDAQADLAGHGGEHRAVFVYQMDSYHYWERFLGRSDFTFGQKTLPVMVRVHLVDEYRAVLPSVTGEISLCITIDIELTHHSPSINWRFPD